MSCKNLKSDVINGESKDESKEAASARLEKLMGHGRFQLFQVWVFGALVNFFGSMNMFQLMFSVTKKPHRCSLPSQIEKNFDYESFAGWSNLTSDCKIAKYDESCDAISFSNPLEVYQSNCFNVSDQVSCTDAFGYTHERNASDSFWSLSAEYDWVCDKADYGANVLTARSAGVVISMLIFMQLSDKWGRSPVLHLTNIIYIVCTFSAMLVADNYFWLMALVAMGSTFPPLGIRLAYTLVAEYSNDIGRSQMYICGWVWWVIGGAFLPVVAWASKDWFTYGIIIPLCNLVIVPFIWLSPESPRLLLTQGKVEKAGKIIRDIMRINKKEIPKNLDEELEDIAKAISAEQTSLGLLTLFKHKRLAFYTCLMSVTWVANDFLYMGGQMNVENLAGNQYINFSLVSLTELPSVFIGEFMINRYGRRWSHVLCMAITTAFFVCAMLIANFEDYGTVVTALAIGAKTVSNVAWFIMWVQAVEIFPTCVRVSGMNFAAIIATVLTMSVPYVVLLGTTNLALMYSCFAAVGVTGVLATLLLPETFQKPLAECVQDIDNRELHPFFSWRVWLKSEDEESNEME